MCVSMRVFIYKLMYLLMYILIDFTYLYKYTLLSHRYVHIHVHVSICVRVCVYLLVFLYVHICAYAHIRMGCVLVKEHSVWSSQMHIKQSTYTHASSMYYKLWKQMHYFNILRLVDKGRIHQWIWWHHVTFLCERYIAMCMSYNVNIKVYVTCMQHTCMHMFVF